MMRKMIASVVLAICVAAAQGVAQTVPDATLERACVTLQKTPSDVKAAQVLQSVAKDKAYPDGWRSRALGVCALTSLIQLNTNQFGHAMAMLERDYPEQRLLTVTLADCVKPCVRCQRTGQQEVSCPTCLASGTCKTCDGKGVRNASPCPTCKGSKLCARCAGSKKMAITCPECKGAKGSFILNEEVKDNCQSLLAELLAEVRESIQTAQALRELEDAWFINVPSAIRRLDTYLATHPHVATQDEFGALRGKLVTRKWVHLAAIILAGCAIFIVLVNILKATVFRPRPEPLRRPPGLANIDYNTFADPLAPDKPRGKK